MQVRRYLSYLKYVFRHKYFVLLECRNLGVPLWIAILHDWDKFLLDELIPYAHYFYNADGSHKEMSPLNATPAFKASWLRHIKRNWHHWQSWLLVMDDGTLHALEMSDVYRREMLADWKGAGRALGFPDTRAWYMARRVTIRLHPETRKWVEEKLNVFQ